MRAVLFGVVLTSALVFNTAARAADDETCDERSTSRVLGDHAFIPLELVSWPFITTYFGFGLGGGLMQQDGVGINASGGQASGSVNLAALAQQINLGIGLFVDELLGVGAVFQYQIGGGAQVRVLKLSRLMLSAGVDFDYSQGKFITPGLAVQTALTSADLSAASDALLNDLSSWSVTPLAAVAVAPVSFFGLQSSVGFQLGSDEVNGQSSSSKGLLWGVGASLDLKGAHLPMAFTVAYQLSTTFDDESKTDHQIEAGAFYSGRSNLDLGMAFNTRLADNDQKMYLGLLRMNYLW
jgi:hypothetical protein